MRRRSKPAWGAACCLRIRQRGSALGAQPDGPIPRFLAASSSRILTTLCCGAQKSLFPKVHVPGSLPRAVQYVPGWDLYFHSRTAGRTRVMPKGRSCSCLSPSRGPPPQQTITTRAAVPGPANMADKPPRPGPIFKLYRSTAILRCRLLWETIW